jgi:hypothetical protein
MMTSIFRGLLDILHKHNDSLHKDLVTHVRKFDMLEEDMDPMDLEVGVYGFWRLMLEQVIGFYTWMTLFTGLVLMFTLSIISYPIRMLVGTISLAFTRSTNIIMADQNEYLREPSNDNQPVDSEVVRRVVYEEAKVPKGAKQ